MLKYRFQICDDLKCSTKNIKGKVKLQVLDLKNHVEKLYGKESSLRREEKFLKVLERFLMKRLKCRPGNSVNKINKWKNLLIKGYHSSYFEALPEILLILRHKVINSPKKEDIDEVF